MANTPNHQAYMQGSPFYRQVYERFGAKLPEETARRILKDHSTSMSDFLEDSGVRPPQAGHFRTLDFVAALGY
jgi:hypothetical protein